MTRAVYSGFVGLFWKRQEAPRPECVGCAKIETQLEQLKVQFRALRDECQAELERAYRHRKAAEARERAAREAAGSPPQGKSPSGAPDSAATPPPFARGVHLRRYINALKRANMRPNGEPIGIERTQQDDSNGVHP